MRDLNERQMLAQYGVHFSEASVYAQDAWRGNYQLALDAQPGLVTTPNAGVPGFLTNIVDPEVVRIIVTPMRAARILGETKKGDWTTLSAQFPTVESAGQIASYGDYNNNGTTDANANWTARQSYHYQTIERWGERQVALWGVAAINYKAELDRAAALVMNKFQNRSYFFGVTGLQNYGLLNDPSLIAPIAPSTKAAGGTTWTNATAQELYNDVLALYGKLNSQMGFNVEMTDNITLVLSPNRLPNLAKVSQFNVTARQTILENFPNLTIETAPEYSTAGGELMQMIVTDFEGVRTGYGAFTEKMRAHPLIPDVSSWKQKMSGGTWGAIIRRPIAIAQELGI